MANQIVISSGAKVRNLNGVLTGTTGVVNSLGINVANGIPQLDGSGKILVSQLPNSVMEYKGTWNAATNTPTLVNGTGNQGDVYLCNVAGTVNFGAGAITFAVGDQAIYSGTIWQKAGGSTGTVTSVAVTETGDALTITGSPITTSGTINIGFAGISGQYVNGAGGLTTFPTLISSIGLSMPSAFTVTNSPLTANGTIAVTGAGTTAQYIRGDGSLATFPTVANEAERLITEVYNDSGATLTKGTVVYINGGQGNLPTVAKALATGDATSAQTYGVVQTDITNMNNGFVVVIGSLTDLDTQAYANGTQLYLSSTVAGAWTSVKQYAPAHLVYVAIVTRSHPTQGVVEVRIQNGFEMDELHNVAAQSPSNGSLLQYVSSTSLWTAVAGTTTNIAEGTNLYFTDTRARNAISLTTTGTSGVATYSGGVLNIPNYGSALSGYVPYTGATTNVDLGIYNMSAAYYKSTNGYVMGQGSTVGLSGAFTVIGATPTSLNIVISNTKTFLLTFPSTSRTYTYPDATGTLALTSDLSGYIQGSGTTNYVPKFTASGTIGNSLIYDTGTRIAIGGTSATYGVLTVQSDAGQFCIQSNTTPGKQLQIGYDHTTNNSYLSSLNQGVAFTPLSLQPNGGQVGIGTITPNKNNVGKALTVNASSGSSMYELTTADSSTTAYWEYTGTNSSIINVANGFLRFGTNNSENMRITSAGTVGINTSSPSSTVCLTLKETSTIAGALNIINRNSTQTWNISVDALAVDDKYLAFTDITNSSVRMYLTATGILNINNLAGTGSRAVLADASGNLSAPVSDISVKQNITTIGYGLSEILKMNPVWFDFIDDYKNYGEGRQNGNIAQEMQEIIPEAVFVTPSTGKMGINYEQMHAVYIKAIQELEARIKQLENK